MSDWYGTGSKVKVFMREFERNHPFGEIYPPRPLPDIFGRDPLDVLLEACALHQQQLCASRDSGAIAKSNANTLMFIDAIRGHL